MLTKQISLEELSELAAEKRVNKSLFKEIARLRGEAKMSKVILSTEGKYYLVHDYEEIDPERVSGEIAHLQTELKSLEAIAPASADAPTADPAPADPQPKPEVPAEAPAPVDEVPAAPAPDAPVEGAPATDPAPAADQPAPATDTVTLQ